MGFVGVGWIGLARMRALVEADLIEPIGVVDANPEMAEAALREAPTAYVAADLDELLSNDAVDGIVIATPSALHAKQTLAALGAGKAVFCQKPLGRNSDEVKAVVSAAERSGGLLGVDLCYRHTEGMRAVRELIDTGALGRVFSVEMKFHNAYGPDKNWFYDPALSGGGCLIDLGVHLIDLALWALRPGEVEILSASLHAKGLPLDPAAAAVEDHAAATLALADGPEIRLACSWGMHAGQDADIAVSFHGSQGGAVFRNVNGSFYDFEAFHFQHTNRRRIANPPDDWGGRAVVDWARQLSLGGGFDSDIRNQVHVARIIDRIYGR